MWVDMDMADTVVMEAMEVMVAMEAMVVTEVHQ
jgi:hypothetical protein